MVVPEEREGKSTEASGVLARDSRLAKEDAISTRKGGQHQKEKHQVNAIFIHYVYQSHCPMHVCVMHHTGIC